MLRSLAILFAVYGNTATAFAPSHAAFVVSDHAVRTTSCSSSSPTTPLSMVAVDTSDIKNGLTVEIDGEPYKVLNFSIMKQARGAAKTTIKFKNLMRGTTIENTYRSGEKFETAQIDRKEAQYTYPDENGNCFFMDMTSFEEIMVEGKVIEDVRKWMTEGIDVTLVEFKGQIIEVQVPATMIFEVKETEPNLKGATAQGLTKPALLDCGATVTVPGFVDVGDMIKVDTTRNEYMERA